MKWEQDQADGFLGWEPPKKGAAAQPRWTDAKVDIEEALTDPQTSAVLGRWVSARLYEGPAYSGGILDAWPALMVDGLAACRQEARAIDDWRRHEDGPESPPPR